MRVTVSMTYQKMMINLDRKAEDADRLATMIASGKRLSKPQDDPRAWAQAMDLKQGLRELEVYQKNVDFAIAWNETTTNALNRFSDFLDQAIQTGTEALNNSEDRATQIQTIELIAQQALDLANNQYQDLYIFGGRKLSTAPFDDSFEYQGYEDTKDFEVRAGKNNSQVINIDGESAFIVDDPELVEPNILKILAALRTALEEVPEDGDMTEVDNAVTALKSAREHIRAQNSLAGLRLSYLDGQKSALETLKLDSKNQLSELEDANTAEAIILLQQNQTALEAALRATAMIDDLSLMKFL